MTNIRPVEVELHLKNIRGGKWYNYDDCIVYSRDTVTKHYHIAGKLRQAEANFIASAPDIARGYLKLHEENKNLLEQLKRLQVTIDDQRSALLFYADKQSWKHVGCISFIGEDQGNLARKALALTATKQEQP